ncbi:MAG: EAL domain-containing protein [Thermoleophilaceae bacterium]
MSPIQTDTRLLVARQPVYDSRLRVVAYELIVQHSDGSPPADDADVSTVISELGLSLVMGQPAHIPVSRSFLLEGFARALPAGRVMLRVSADLQLDRSALAALRELSSAGYPLVLDRFSRGTPAEGLLDVASVVGIDVHALAGSDVRALQSGLQGHHVRLLAQNVEDHDELEICRLHGFELLQGYFFCRPRVVSGRGVQVNLLNRVRLAAILQGDSVEIDRVEETISRDVGLSYNLLRFINSAFFSLPRRIDSIRDALVMLGLANVRRWATLMALADADDKPRELMITGLVRARMCELLAGASDQADQTGYFTVGLFSVVDALTDTSMVELLASLPLSQEIIAALLNYEGAKGRMLRAAIAYERGNFAELGDLPPLSVSVSEIYAQSVEWATDACGVIS